MHTIVCAYIAWTNKKRMSKFLLPKGKKSLLHTLLTTHIE
jgi:hypothetical protein